MIAGFMHLSADINKIRNLLVGNRSSWWLIPTTEAYLEPCQTSKMEYFAKIVNDFRCLTEFKTAVHRFLSKYFKKFI